MPKIQEPLLACDFIPEKHLPMLPFYATPKVDGIRFYMKDGVAWARSGHQIPNRRLQKVLCGNFPDGIEGELVSGNYATDDHFQCTTSMVMSADFCIENFVAWLFDYITPDSPIQPYNLRLGYLKVWYQQFCRYHSEYAVHTRLLTPTILRKPEHVDKFLDDCLAKGYEGIILRKPDGLYKFGRSTASEALLLRLKPLADAEAVIIGFKELERNENPPKLSPTGKTMRSTAIAGKCPADTLGGFRVRDIVSNVEFSVGGGPGFTEAFRKSVWLDQHAYLGRVIKYSYLSAGTKPGGKPRMPKFIGFRHELDMSSPVDS